MVTWNLAYFCNILKHAEQCQDNTQNLAIKDYNMNTLQSRDYCKYALPIEENDSETPRLTGWAKG